MQPSISWVSAPAIEFARTERGQKKVPVMSSRTTEDRDTVGDLAIVLHSHMPYVEGFGTYPFGEEWLFDAYLRSHLRVLEVADRLTMTVTPVLADQLEAEGVSGRLEEFTRSFRLGPARAEVENGQGDLEAAAVQSRDFEWALGRLGELGGDLLEPFRTAQTSGRVELMTSAATHAVLPLLATRAGGRLQVDAGLRSHIRRFGRPGGFWLPECAFSHGVDSLLAERGLEFTCLDQSRFEPDGAALSPVRLPSGIVGFTIDWPMVDLVWGQQGFPADPAYLDFHRQSMEGIRLWDIAGEIWSEQAARAKAREHADAFCAAVAERLENHRRSNGSRGVCVFAIDTELLGHWWYEGPWWLEEVLGRAQGAGIDLVRLPDALEDHQAEERPCATSSWGERKDLSTWGSRKVADLARAARRSELTLVEHALRAGRAGGEISLRAGRELLALQSSDWAFIDFRNQAGDYAFDRAVSHAEGLLEAIESPQAKAEGLRNLAPDLSLDPLLEP